MAEKAITAPLSPEIIQSLHVGDIVQMTGILYTGRDAAHKKMCELIKEGKDLPLNLTGEVIYYAGPCPPKPGESTGSIGPTTASRMDSYSPILMAYGLIAMIGKGGRSLEVIEAIKKYHGIYFAGIGGVAAIMGKCVTSSEIVAFPELGPEAIRRLTVKDLPLIVAVDVNGENLYTRKS